MHPFSLNDEEIKQVGGGIIRPDPIIDTTYLYEEVGGLTPPSETTLALGEEGGLPPVSDI